MFRRTLSSLFPLAVIISSYVCVAFGQGATGTLRGRVLDPNGAVVAGATVQFIDPAGKETAITTNSEGVFNARVAPGTYKIVVLAKGFQRTEVQDLNVSAGQVLDRDIQIEIGEVVEEILVGQPDAVNTDPDANASATVLKGKDIDALPDDPAELEAALQALAGPGAGPNGGEIFIDGFSGGRMPRRDTIREIRINQNPFSSEFDRLGLGRIEILTKPGTEEWHAEAGYEFEDESLNSRNPFATNRPAFQVRNLSGELSGPIIKNRASFFVDIEKQTTDNNSLINALVLDPNLSVVAFRQAVLVPTKGFEFSPRVDVAISPTHTLAARYSYETSSRTNSGLGGFDLPSRAFSSSDSEHLFRLNDTLVISPTTINEVRFQYIRRRNNEEAEDTSPIVRIPEYFTSGGANAAFAFSNEDRYELQNYTSFIRGSHTLKSGVRLRHVSLADSSPGNFAGTFTFTTIDQYRETIQNVAGARPTQFTIAAGEPLATVKRTDVGLFFQDDWRVRPDLTLSMGLRYETQTNISSPFNFAPRFGFAYSPGAGGKDPAKTVFRGGFGIFYDRFSENLTLQTDRYNGVNQQQYIVTDETPEGRAILDLPVFTQGGVSNVPSAALLAAFGQKQTTRIVSPTLDSPYTMQAVFSVERQLARGTTVSATFSNTWTRRMLRSRNINAPVTPGGPVPDPVSGNIFQYEATGRFDQSQLIVNFRSNPRDGIRIFGNYSLGRAQSDTDGSGTFPRDQYDPSGEYGDALQDVRHRFTVGGNFDTFWGVRLNPFVTYRTGVPFNITTGDDDNGDRIFSDRPTFGELPAACALRGLNASYCDIAGRDPNLIIPRNYGRGSDFLNVNLRIVKEWGFGPKARTGDDDEEESMYYIEFSTQIRNLFNHTNNGNPVGNLSSPLFGRPVALAGGFGAGGGGAQTAGNRRIRFEVTFSF